MKISTIQNVVLMFTQFILTTPLAVYLSFICCCILVFEKLPLSKVMLQKWLFNFLTFQMAIWHLKFERDQRRLCELEH